MAFAAEFHMPGSYHFDGPSAANPVLSAGIFRPPVSPSASTYNLAKSTGSLYSDVSMSNNTPYPTAKRKRVSTRESTPVEWNMNMDGAGDAREEEFLAESGRQIRYTLAGQIDTPGSMPPGAGGGPLDDSMYSDVDYRRDLGSKRHREDPSSTAPRLSGLRYSTDGPGTPNSSGWSSFAFHAIGGVVGKVWEFCKTAPFRGFQAGEGRAYEAAWSPPTGAAHQRPIELQTRDSIDAQAIPGGFPRGESFETAGRVPEAETEAEPTLPPAARPAAKRRQVSENEELRRNWVIVDDPPTPSAKRYSTGGASRASTGGGRGSAARHRTSGYGTPGSAGGSSRRFNVPVSRLGGGATPHAMTKRTSLRISHAGSPSLSAREPASFAQPRSPVAFDPAAGAPTSRPQSIGPGANPFAVVGGAGSHLQSQQQTRIPSPVPSPGGGGHRRSHSAASAAASGFPARRGKLDVENIEASPRLSAEAKQLAHKKLAADKAAETKVDAFNARLLSMIRQGKEALGTTVEVYDDDDDDDNGGGVGGGGGGWEDEDD